MTLTFFCLIKILTHFLKYLMKNFLKNSFYEKIGDWLKANKLSLNNRKTKCTLFHGKSSIGDLPLKLPVLKIEDNKIETKTAIKCLGVMLEESIS